MREPGPGDRSGEQDPVVPRGVDRDPPIGGSARGARPLDAVRPDALVEGVFRREQGRAVATLIRVLGDFDLAEESVQEAFATALTTWAERGIPQNPGAWIVTTARNRAIDRLRRERVGRDKLEAIGRLEDLRVNETHEIPDERLRLIFTCCHPALALECGNAIVAKPASSRRCRC